MIDTPFILLIVGGIDELSWTCNQGGDGSALIIKQIAARLKELGYVPTSPAGIFDASFKSLVMVFQAQHVDSLGRPLKIDGDVGPITWGTLFPVPETAAGAGFLAEAALAKAISQIGVREVPIGSNRGPEVDRYLASTGLGGGFFWCMAFVHWCFMEAADDLGVANPFPRTAGVLKAWNDSSAFRISKSKAIQNPSLVVPGSVFILDYGNGFGHTGIVRSSSNGALRTVEGNTNTDGSSNGIGVFQLNQRSVMNARLKGFIIVP